MLRLSPGNLSRSSQIRGRIALALLKHEWLRGYLLLAPTIITMALALALPLGVLVVYSFWTQEYLDIDYNLTVENYQRFFSKDVFPMLFLRTLKIAAGATLSTILLAYPMAYIVAFHVKKHKTLILILVALPFFSSYLLRIFAWKLILGYNGIINSGLVATGVIDTPLSVFLYNPAAVYITLSHTWALFALLPIYVSLEKIDRNYLEAATDLGDTPVMRFIRVTLPLSLPGIVAAYMLVFIPTVGDYVTPQLVGGRRGIMFGNVIQSQFGAGNDWPFGAALSIISMTAVAVITLIIVWLTRRWRA